MTRHAIDPLTRVGGHLRIEVEVAGGTVTDAWSSGTVFRGMEAILEGRDAREAWLLAQRVCGLCTGVHALASVRAVENALGLAIPKNARLVRNILAGTQLVLDHVIHFYHLHAVDWVDTAAALTADPAAAADWVTSLGVTNATPASFQAARDRIAATVHAGETGAFSTAFAGHPAYELSPAADLAILTHYIEALDWQRKVMKIQALLGGKSPHPQTFLVGGMAVAPPWGGPSVGGPGEHPSVGRDEAAAALSDGGLAEMADLITTARTFVEQVYLPDVVALAGVYADWAKLGKGIGNYLAYGDFPEDDSAAPALYLPSGRLMDHSLATVLEVHQESVAESVAHAWYTDDSDAGALLRPSDAAPEPRYAGPTPPYTTLAGSDRYSWIKAPRLESQPMEVGPLARMLVAYVQGQQDVQQAIQIVVSKLGLGPDALFSTLGRTVARAIETKVIVERLTLWQDQLATNLAKGDVALVDLSMWDPSSWPAQAQGWSLGESARGAVGHWVTLGGGWIQRYAIVDATTWNASPRDAKGWRGAIEEALIGTPVADISRPLEILRTVHSFDPCAACAVHQLDSTSDGPIEVRVREVTR